MIPGIFVGLVEEGRIKPPNNGSEISGTRLCRVSPSNLTTGHPLVLAVGRDFKHKLLINGLFCVVDCSLAICLCIFSAVQPFFHVYCIYYEVPLFQRFF